KAQLIQNFGLDDRHSQAILDMRLVRLTGLERDKIEAEYQDLQAKIADYKDILAKPERIDEIIYNELLDIQKRFGDDRRTKIAEGEAVSIEDEDLIEQKDVLLTLTHNG
ncbi:DNA gyrase subunit A, partial [Bifidobacterium sp. UMB1197]|nr:DNA gyrase subunit A [Bifidobacterium sp. UMB1197]